MKKKWWGFISLIIIAVLVYLVLRKINFIEVRLLLHYAKPLYLLLAVLAMFLTFIVWAFRWTIFFGPLFKGDFWFLLSVLFAGSFFNSITPGAGVGGEPFRAHFLSKRYKQSKVKMLAYVLGDKFFQLILLALFGVFSIFFVFIYVNISNTLKYILEGVLLVVLSLIGLAVYLLLKKSHYNLGSFLKKLHFFEFIKKRFETQEELEKYINHKIKLFTKIFRSVVVTKKNLIIGFSLSLIFWMLIYLTSYFIFLAFGYHINFLSVIVVVTLGNLVGDLSLVPSGIGIVEISMTLLYSAMGIFPPLALLAAVFSRLIYYIFSIGVGGFSLLHVRRVTNGKK